MIVDTSALVSLVRVETEAQRCLGHMLSASDRHMSAGNVLEAYLVIDGARNPSLSVKLDAVIGELHLVIEPVTYAHIQIGRDAFRRFGKGSGHLAPQLRRLLCYALARALDEPLLFVGNDFAQTDIGRVM